MRLQKMATLAVCLTVAGLAAGYYIWHQAAKPTDETFHLESVDPSAKTTIIFYSGDGGWRSFDVHLTDSIIKAGGSHAFSIIGIDTLKYFSVSRDAASTAKDLETLVETHAVNQQKVILLGFSFGADILPEVFNNLSPAIRSRVIMVGLLSPGPYAQFRISLDDVLLQNPVLPKEIHPTLPEVHKIDPVLLVCVYGDKGLVDTICPDPWFIKGELIGLEGNHHFDKKYDILARRIVQSIKYHIQK